MYHIYTYIRAHHYLVCFSVARSNYFPFLLYVFLRDTPIQVIHFRNLSISTIAYDVSATDTENPAADTWVPYYRKSTCFKRRDSLPSAAFGFFTRATILSAGGSHVHFVSPPSIRLFFVQIEYCTKLGRPAAAAPGNEPGYSNRLPQRHQPNAAPCLAGGRRRLRRL